MSVEGVNGVGMSDSGGRVAVPGRRPTAAALPWGAGTWAVLLQPGSETAALGAALRRLPEGALFDQAHGDVDLILVCRLPGDAEQEPPAAPARAADPSEASASAGDGPDGDPASAGARDAVVRETVRGVFFLAGHGLGLLDDVDAGLSGLGAAPGGIAGLRERTAELRTVLETLYDSGRSCDARLGLGVEREIAERLAAKPGTSR
jgi:uncharacterized repeat protein (TIGR03917 family)